jgi:hypothetical protein
VRVGAPDFSDGVLQLPRERGLSLRELLSLQIVASQHTRPWLGLQQPGALGFSGSRILHDGEVSELCEWAFGYTPGSLGPGGALGYSFRNSLLDTPSSRATEYATALLQNVRDRLKSLERDCMQGRKQDLVQSVFRSLFREMFQGAGHSPDAPDRDGWVELGSSPALTEGLGWISQSNKVTVCDTVECVASAREGAEPVVFDEHGRMAPYIYQPILLMAKHAAEAAGAGGSRVFCLPAV